MMDNNRCLNPRMARRFDLVQAVVADGMVFPAYRVMQGVRTCIAPVAVQVVFAQG